MKKILFLALVTIATKSYSQKDIYYITTNGDTVFCKKIEFTYLFGPKIAKFKLIVVDNQNTKQKIELKEISKVQGYFSHNSYTTSILEKENLTQFEVHTIKEITSKNPIPLTLIAENNGNKLFYYSHNQGMTTEAKYYYYISNTMIELKKDNYKEKLKIIFSNCNIVIDKLNGKKNYSNKIDELIEDYYRCINKKFAKK